MRGERGREADLSPRSDQYEGGSNIALPRDLTTRLTSNRMDDAEVCFEGYMVQTAGNSDRSDCRSKLFRRVRGRRCRRRCLSGGSGGLSGRRRLRLCIRIDPAAVHPAVQAGRHLGVDQSAKPRQASERRLDVAARAAEPVVQVEMAERGVEIVEPHQAHDPSTKPDTFRISGGPVEDLGRLDEFIGLALAVLGGIGRIGGTGCGRLLGLILGAKIATLGNGSSDTDQEREAGHGEAT
jgi:hypothetical protein